MLTGDAGITVFHGCRMGLGSVSLPPSRVTNGEAKSRERLMRPYAMRIYLHLCCFNRPYDGQSQTRIRLGWLGLGSSGCPSRCEPPVFLPGRAEGSLHSTPATQVAQRRRRREPPDGGCEPKCDFSKMRFFAGSAGRARLLPSRISGRSSAQTFSALSKPSLGETIP